VIPFHPTFFPKPKRKKTKQKQTTDIKKLKTKRACVRNEKKLKKKREAKSLYLKDYVMSLV